MCLPLAGGKSDSQAPLSPPGTRRELRTLHSFPRGPGLPQQTRSSRLDPTRTGAGQQPQPSRAAGWGRVCRRRGGSLRGGQGLLSPGAKCEKALGVPRHSTEVSLSVLWAPVSARWPGPHRTTVSLKTTRGRPRCACLQMPGPGRRTHPAPQPGNEVTLGGAGGAGRAGEGGPARPARRVGTLGFVPPDT